MKFFCLLPVRDEADIIGQCLERLLLWADRIYVFDTGSVDATWEIILDYASRNKKIKPLRKDNVYYCETKLRGYIFHQARQEMRDGDWFARVDADEFHYIFPNQFVKECIQKHETIVYHQYYNFELTEAEAENLDSPEIIHEDRKRPIEERRRYYSISQYSEPRLCRYRTGMKWPMHASFPYNAGFIAKERIPILHYPNRDPFQMERRCTLRAIMLADDENGLNWAGAENMHWTIPDWTKFIVKNNDPRLHFWLPGTDLPEIKQLNHLAGPRRRMLQRIIHSFFLPLLDSTRPGYPENGYPQKINPEVIHLLKASLSRTGTYFKLK
jgi:hypothetical protein